MQTNGVSGAAAAVGPLVDKLADNSVEQVQALSVKRVRRGRCFECRTSVFQMQANRADACRICTDDASPPA